MKNPYLSFITQKKVFLPILLFLFMELSLQFGCYKFFLKKSSYAANVNLITDYAIKKKEPLNPDYLILGTSVAYQGISIPLINEKLKIINKTAQSIAIPGSELLVQNLAFLKVEKSLKNVKTVIHIVEESRPWATHKKLILPTLAMISELDRKKALSKIYTYDYNTNYDDFSYIFFRSIAYRRDIRDFFLNPTERIKYLSKKLRSKDERLFYYQNAYSQKISSYNFKDVHTCIEETKLDYIPKDSDFYHKKALLETCSLAKITKPVNIENESTKLYFSRLNLLYNSIQSKGKNLVIIFAPSSSIISYLKSEKRNQIWKKNLDLIFQNTKKPLLIHDLQHIFKDKINGDYYYDLIHLNKFGMEIFTKEISHLILKLEK